MHLCPFSVVQSTQSAESKSEKYEPHVGQSYGGPHFASKLGKTGMVTVSE